MSDLSLVRIRRRRPLEPCPRSELDSAWRAGGRAGKKGAAVLYCVECGCCSGELGQGWVAFRCDDPDETEPPALALYCPPCAAAEFGYRPDAAASYVCAWEALPSVPEDGPV